MTVSVLTPGQAGSGEACKAGLLNREQFCPRGDIWPCL